MGTGAAPARIPRAFQAFAVANAMSLFGDVVNMIALSLFAVLLGVAACTGAADGFTQIACTARLQQVPDDDRGLARRAAVRSPEAPGRLRRTGNVPRDRRPLARDA
jgi:hypothetical protein